MTVRNRRLHEKLGMDRVRGCNAEKLLSFCHLTKQRLINELADEVNERHSWHDAASPDYRPKFHVFTEKAYRRVNPDEVTTDWRAVCERTARTVRRAGTAKAVPDPYQVKTGPRPKECRVTEDATLAVPLTATPRFV